MKQVLGNRASEWEELILRCDVGCDDFLIFTAYEDEEDNYLELSLVAEMRPVSFLDGLRGIFDLVFRGRWHRASVDLSRHSLLKIREWCDEMLLRTE